MTQNYLHALRQRIGQLAALHQQSQHTGQRVWEAAATRSDAITAELGRLAKSAITDPDAAQRYLARVEERGRLQRILAR